MPLSRSTLLLALTLAGAALVAACGGGGDLTQQAAAETAPADSEQASGEQSATAQSAAAPASGIVPGLPGSRPPADPAQGRQVFFANGCTVCHGEQGEGRIGPTLAQTRLDIDEVIAQVRRPRGMMPRYNVTIIPDDQLAQVLAWLGTLALPSRIVPGSGTP